jgi:hypothetical protein
VQYPVSQQSLLISGESTKQDDNKQKNENKETKVRCSMVFIDKKRGIDPVTHLQLVLSPDGNVRFAGVGIRKPIKKDNITNVILEDSDKLLPQEAIEVTLLVDETVSAKILKRFVDDISDNLQSNKSNKSVVFYIWVTK